MLVGRSPTKTLETGGRASSVYMDLFQPLQFVRLQSDCRAQVVLPQYLRFIIFLLVCTGREAWRSIVQVSWKSKINITVCLSPQRLYYRYLEKLPYLLWDRKIHTTTYAKWALFDEAHCLVSFYIASFVLWLQYIVLLCSRLTLNQDNHIHCMNTDVMEQIHVYAWHPTSLL